MAIPDYQTVMLPLLDFVSDGMEHHIKKVREALAVHVDLREDEKREFLPSGKQPTFNTDWLRTATSLLEDHGSRAVTL
jgi:restriction system protein